MEPFSLEPSPLIHIPLIIQEPPLNLRQCRQVMEMTQKQFADVLEISIPWLCRLERGHDTPSKTLKMALIALILTKTAADRSASRSRLRKIIARDGARISHRVDKPGRLKRRTCLPKTAGRRERLIKKLIE